MATVLFDMSRIFIRGSRFSPTGIDRVVMAYARWLLARDDIDLQPVVTFRGALLAVPRRMLERTVRQNEAFAHLRNDGTDRHPNWAALRAALGSDLDSAKPLRAPGVAGQIPARARWHLSIGGRALANLRRLSPAGRATYINVSHTGLDQPRVLARLAEREIAPVVMVHDLIPINFPEYCAPAAEGRHQRRMREVIDQAALVITNSETTAAEFRAYADRLGRPAPPVEVAPLGLEADFLDPPPPLTTPRPYFVCVGTLEARKNVAFLLALWRRLAEAQGPDAPRLVLVGRRGWENEAIIDHLQRSHAVIRLVHEVSDLSDHELAQLVGGAAALLSPSVAEGFDLPVVEALALRTPVIASDIPAHRELAGGSARLVDPVDGSGWMRMIADAVDARQRGPIYDAPTWAGHFDKVGAAIARQAALTESAWSSAIPASAGPLSSR